MQLVFEWDPRKDRANLEKHRVSFSEASSVFGDPLARIFADKRHSEEERERLSSATRGRGCCYWFVSRSAEKAGFESLVLGG